MACARLSRAVSEQTTPGLLAATSDSLIVNAAAPGSDWRSAESGVASGPTRQSDHLQIAPRMTAKAIENG